VHSHDSATELTTAGRWTYSILYCASRRSIGILCWPNNELPSITLADLKAALLARETLGGGGFAQPRVRVQANSAMAFANVGLSVVLVGPRSCMVSLSDILSLGQPEPRAGLSVAGAPTDRTIAPSCIFALALYSLPGTLRHHHHQIRFWAPNTGSARRGEGTAFREQGSEADAVSKSTTRTGLMMRLCVFVAGKERGPVPRP
jgi:hypothetical protein